MYRELKGIPEPEDIFVEESVSTPELRELVDDYFEED